MEGSRVGGFGAFGFRAQGAQTLRSPKIPTPKPQNPFLRPPLRPPPPRSRPQGPGPCLVTEPAATAACRDGRCPATPRLHRLRKRNLPVSGPWLRVSRRRGFFSCNTQGCNKESGCARQAPNSNSQRRRAKPSNPDATTCCCSAPCVECKASGLALHCPTSTELLGNDGG